MTEDAIYATLLEVKGEIAENTIRLDTIDKTLVSGDNRMQRIEGSIGALPCFAKAQSCPTQQIPLPAAPSSDPQAVEAQVIGNVVLKAWVAIPHSWRFAIVLGAGVGGGSQVKPLLLYLANHLQ